jgi:hypothetical protein
VTVVCGSHDRLRCTQTEREKPNEKKKRELFQREKQEMVAMGKDLFRARATSSDATDANAGSNGHHYFDVQQLSGPQLLDHARPMFEVRDLCLLLNLSL